MKTTTAKYKRGQKMEVTRTNRFGQKITEILTIVAVDWNFILMDDGTKFFITNKNQK